MTQLYYNPMYLYSLITPIFVLVVVVVGFTVKLTQICAPKLDKDDVTVMEIIGSCSRKRQSSQEVKFFSK